MFWNVGTLITIAATILYGVIFTLVAVSKPFNRLKRIFSLYLFAMAAWSISAFFVLSGLVDVMLWFRVMIAAPIVMGVAFFYFTQTMFGLRRKWAPITLIYGSLVILVTFFTKLMIQSASLDQTGMLNYELGPFFSLIASPGYLMIFVSIRDLIRGYARTQDIDQRNRIRYLIIGFIITILAGFTNFTPLGKYPVDIAANGFTALLIAYTILRHRLLDIRLVIRLGILYSITSAIFSTIYFLIISLVLNAFQLLTGKTVILVSIFVGVFSAFVLSPLRNLAQSWIDRIFFRDKYDAEKMLQRLSQVTTSLLDIKKITATVLSEVTQTLHIENGAILIKNMESGEFQVAAGIGENGLRSGFRSDNPIVIRMADQNQLLTYNQLAMVTSFRSMWKEEKEELERFSAKLFLPINTKGKLIGIIVLGNKLSSQPYTQDEQVIFSTLANQVAVAIENARLYDELKGALIQTVIALANAMDIRDTYTNAHSQQIADLATRTARALNCSPEDIQEIYLGGLLHDIGKIGIPDAILLKPGKLNEEEWKIVREHTNLGVALISPIKELANVSQLVKYSHERYDGTGYPEGIKGEQIPLGARIISVVDSFSAMHDKRPYKEPYDREEIIRELKDNCNRMYDPRVVEAFLKILEADDS